MAVNGNDFRTAVSRWDGHATVAVTGEIDLATAAELEGRVKECLARRPRRVDLDFARVRFCDCSGVDALERLHRQAQEEGVVLKVTDVRAPIVARLFDLLGLTDLVEPGRTDTGPRTAALPRPAHPIPGTDSASTDRSRTTLPAAGQTPGTGPV
ncbi:STAS domain-containing protein [Streptomyces sp. FH025]|uniref:STAS domain-containing protein n=1 Tax=Streptomyces sp. FH025 TaxID=2815937 RepID=UPI001A9E0DC7|nr:STAS domain-containing protein [Streptomyces sp. FH025]MBO1419175.1 STAS domain-containing protein [Streptomyces sp. FH025]